MLLLLGFARNLSLRTCAFPPSPPPLTNPPLSPSSAGGLGQKFIDALPSSSFSLRYFANAEDAYRSARHGDVWGFVSIPSNYTIDAIDWAVHKPGSALPQISYALDESNQQIAVFLTQSMASAFESMIDTSLPPNVSLATPLVSQQPVFGSSHYTFTDFIAFVSFFDSPINLICVLILPRPGMVATISFSQAIGLTAVAFVVDQKSGTLDRMWAAGVRASEVMMSQVITQFFVLLGQVLLLLFVALVIFKLPMVGNVGLVIGVAMLLGLTGMIYGLVIATICEEERSAMQMALGSFFPALLLSGVLWPVQGVPVPLNYVSNALPTTWAADSVRSIMSRGWGIEYFEVWMGFVVPLAWAAFLFLIAVRGMRTQQP